MYVDEEEYQQDVLKQRSEEETYYLDKIDMYKFDKKEKHESTATVLNSKIVECNINGGSSGWKEVISMETRGLGQKKKERKRY